MMSALLKLRARRAALQNDDRGFSLIELLVVVLILGILAAIAIPVFLGQQQQAQDAAAKSDLANAKVAYVSYLVENPAGVADEAARVGAVATALNDFGWPDGVEIGTGGGAADFCLTTVSDSTKQFEIRNNTGAVEGTCA